MKKAIIIGSIILTICLFCISYFGFESSTKSPVEVFCKKCGQENCICDVDIPVIEELDSQTESRIKQDYKAYLAHFKNISVEEDDISIIGYFGTYSGHYDVTSIAIKFIVRNMDYLQVKHEIVIGGIGDKSRFIYPDSNAIMIWCIPHMANLTQWNIHRMQTAFGYGFLTSSEVKIIGALHEAESLEYYKNNRFDIELEKRIKQDFYYRNGMDRTYTYDGVVYGYSYDDVYILKYCGIYSSGAVALMMSASAFGYLTVLTSETVEDITFNYPDSNQMQIWHEGKFYKLSDSRNYKFIDGKYDLDEWEIVPGAYTLGLITYEELLIMHALYNA